MSYTLPPHSVIPRIFSWENSREIQPIYDVHGTMDRLRIIVTIQAIAEFGVC